MTAMNSPVVTSSGKLLGMLNDSTSIYSFKGIPFAASPVGDRRWKAPQPAQPWSGIREANRFGPRPIVLQVSQIWKH